MLRLRELEKVQIVSKLTFLRKTFGPCALDPTHAVVSDKYLKPY